MERDILNNLFGPDIPAPYDPKDPLSKAIYEAVQDALHEGGQLIDSTINPTMEEA